MIITGSRDNPSMLSTLVSSYAFFIIIASIDSNLIASASSDFSCSLHKNLYIIYTSGLDY